MLDFLWTTTTTTIHSAAHDDDANGTRSFWFGGSSGSPCQKKNSNNTMTMISTLSLRDWWSFLSTRAQDDQPHCSSSNDNDEAMKTASPSVLPLIAKHLGGLPTTTIAKTEQQERNTPPSLPSPSAMQQDWQLNKTPHSLNVDMYLYSPRQLGGSWSNTSVLLLLFVGILGVLSKFLIQRKIQQLQQENQELWGKYQSSNAMVQEQADQIHSLEQERDSAHDETALLHDENAVLRRQTYDTESRLMESTHQLYTVCRDCETLEQENGTLHLDVNDTAKDWSGQLYTACRDSETLLQENGALYHRCNNLAGHLYTVCRDYETLEQEKKTLEQENGETRREIKGMQWKFECLQEENTRLQDDWGPNHLEQENSTLQDSYLEERTISQRPMLSEEYCAEEYCAATALLGLQTPTAAEESDEDHMDDDNGKMKALSLFMRVLCLETDKRDWQEKYNAAEASRRAEHEQNERQRNQCWHETATLQASLAARSRGFCVNCNRNKVAVLCQPCDCWCLCRPCHDALRQGAEKYGLPPRCPACGEMIQRIKSKRYTA